jgi:HSP20 family protein
MPETTRRAVVPKRFIDEYDPFRSFFQSPLRLSRLLQVPVGDEAPASGWAPAMDVVETADGYEISVELPGTRKEDVTIECHENQLTIKGQKQSEREETEGHRHFQERTFGSFSRSLRLPNDASDRVQARFKDGVLTVLIPKVEERKPRVVAIE